MEAATSHIGRGGSPVTIEPLARLYPMLLADLRYAAPHIAKVPRLHRRQVLTMALTIGANTAIFSVVNAVLIRPLPFASPERLDASGREER